MSLPFGPGQQLVSDMEKSGLSAYLPGHPRIKLKDKFRLCRFLVRDLDLGDLELMAPRLWVMSTHSHTNISALHRQQVKGRQIVVAEDHKFHLVWFYDRIFVKPIPRYLLSASFWQEYLISRSSPLGGGKQQDSIRRAASGFLRTYALLIRHESDFHIAKRENLRLIPAETTWEQLSEFLEQVENIVDSDVAQRYQYGEIRLSRLNFYAKFFLGKTNFHRTHGQYSAYFAQYYGPLLFVFAILSVLLAALQVELQAESLFMTADQWQAVWQIGRYFSIVTVLCTAVMSVWLIGTLIGKICKEWVHALGEERLRKQAVRV